MTPRLFWKFPAGVFHSVKPSWSNPNIPGGKTSCFPKSAWDLLPWSFTCPPNRMGRRFSLASSTSGTWKSSDCVPCMPVGGSYTLPVPTSVCTSPCFMSLMQDKISSLLYHTSSSVPLHFYCGPNITRNHTSSNLLQSKSYWKTAGMGVLWSPSCCPVKATLCLRTSPKPFDAHVYICPWHPPVLQGWGGGPSSLTWPATQGKQPRTFLSFAKKSIHHNAVI